VASIGGVPEEHDLPGLIDNFFFAEKECRERHEPGKQSSGM
jgi:hypothetical protein